MEDTAVVTAKVDQHLNRQKGQFSKNKSKTPFNKDKTKGQFNGEKTLIDDGEPDEQGGTDELNDTIFIRNVSRFDTTAESLKEFIEENFGETVYCLICKDKETGESKGTAFVKFKSAETAQECLEEFEDRDLQTKFFLDGRNLFVLPALTREKAGEVKRAVAAVHDPPKEKKIKTKPRYNRPKPISQLTNDNTEPGQVAASPQKRSAFKKTAPFKKHDSAKKKHQKHQQNQHQHQDQHQHQKKPATRQVKSGPRGGKKTKVKPGKKGSKSCVKKAKPKQRGRHSH